MLLLLPNFSLFAQVQLGSTISNPDALEPGHVIISDNGNRLVVSALNLLNDPDNAGYLAVYEWNGSDWQQVGNAFSGTEQGDRLGQGKAISSDGNRLAIGTPGSGNNFLSFVKIYDWSGSDWVQVGTPINAESAGDLFGTSISFSENGNTLAIGAPRNDGHADNSGHVRIFSWNASEWQQLGDAIDGEAAQDFSGGSISINASGHIIAIGAIGNDATAEGAGHIRIFNWNGNNWQKRGDDIKGSFPDEGRGAQVHLSDDANRLFFMNNCGDPYCETKSTVYMQWDGSNWNQIGDSSSGFYLSDMALSSNGTRKAVVAPSSWYPAPGFVVVTDWDGSSSYSVLNLEEDGNDAVSLSSDGSRIVLSTVTGETRVFELTPTFIKDMPTNNPFQISPNPTPSSIVLEGLPLENSVQVINSLGVLMKSLSNVEQAIHLSGLSNGMYFILIETEEGIFADRVLKN